MSMIVQSIFLLGGIVCLIFTMLSARDYKEENNKDGSRMIIFFFFCIGIAGIWFGTTGFVSGTAHGGLIPWWGIDDGVYMMQSDLVPVQGDASLRVLLVPITNVQQNNSINVEPTYWYFPRDRVVLPLKKGDIIEVRNGLMAKSDFLENK